jgi:hypothetical protein
MPSMPPEPESPPSTSTAKTSLALGLSFGLLFLVLLAIAILFIRAKLRRHSAVQGNQDKGHAVVHIYHDPHTSRAEYLSADISQVAEKVQINSSRCLRMAQAAHRLAQVVTKIEDNAAKHSSVMKACELDDLAVSCKRTLMRCRACVAFWSEVPLDDTEVSSKFSPFYPPSV